MVAVQVSGFNVEARCELKAVDLVPSDGLDFISESSLAVVGVMVTGPVEFNG